VTHQWKAAFVSVNESDQASEFWTFVSSGDTESDRGSILVSGAYLELCIDRLISAYLRKSKSSERLLRKDGPLGSYIARLDLCYCLGLIDEQELRSLRLFARIRNKFAHSIFISAESNEVNDQALELAKQVGLESLETHTFEKLVAMGARHLLFVSAFIMADRVRERDQLVDQMIDNLRLDFSSFHHELMELVEEAERENETRL
jgi:DNA-binding MltR family transcriptional regulator